MPKRRMTPIHRRAALTLLAVALYGLALSLPLPIPAEQQRVVALLVLVGVLWLTEALPLFVTALLIPLALLLTLGMSQSDVLRPFADPVIALFFGSFVLAVAVSTSSLDDRIARVLASLTRGSASGMIFGLVLTSAVLGMWISNTATVALLLPVVLLLNKRLKGRAPRLTKALLFALTMGAALGGMATPIGTPPNAIAVRYLAEAGEPLTFAAWLSFGVPIVLILIPIIWLLLLALLRPEVRRVPVSHARATRGSWTRSDVLTIGVGLVAIALWVSEPLHGIPPATTSLSAAVLCFALNLLRPSDLSKVPFSALILFGGGLALGDAMRSTGLTVTIVELFNNASQQHVFVLLALLMLVGIALTTVGSNTATAAVFVPVVVSVAAAAGVPATPLVVGATLALSVDFITPVGTAPSTLIYSTGMLRVMDFIRVGTVITLAAASLIFVVVSLFLA